MCAFWMNGSLNFSPGSLIALADDTPELGDHHLFGFTDGEGRVVHHDSRRDEQDDPDAFEFHFYLPAGLMRLSNGSAAF